jgi:triosephosphate isomerase
MTMTARRPIIVGNWKMNLGGHQGLDQAQHLLEQVDASKADRPQLVILPPVTVLARLQDLMSSTNKGVEYGAQDRSPHDDGAFTGDISASMLAELGCGYVLAGHSERRDHHGENDWVVNAKITAALRHRLTPVLPVGEGVEVRRQVRQISHTLAQVDDALTAVSPDDVANMLIAYEPVWAIGTGHVATPEDAQEVCAAIRARIAEQYGSSVAERIRILYGGSVKSSTSAAIIEQADIDGALVGGASLDPAELAAIWRSAHHPTPAEAHT